MCLITIQKIFYDHCGHISSFGHLQRCPIGNGLNLDCPASLNTESHLPLDFADCACLYCFKDAMLRRSQLYARAYFDMMYAYRPPGPPPPPPAQQSPVPQESPVQQQSPAQQQPPAPQQ